MLNYSQCSIVLFILHRRFRVYVNNSAKTHVNLDIKLNDAMVSEGLIDIRVHPLVLLNISDYYTRSLRENTGPIAGLCLGTHNGRQVTIQTSLEVLLKEGEVDPSWMETRLDQCTLNTRTTLTTDKQVLPDLDVMGWYSIGDDVSPFTEKTHDFMTIRFESPLLLLLDPSDPGLGLKVYENGVVADWTLETGEAERIAVNQVTKSSSSTAHDPDSGTVKYLTTQTGAIKQLIERIKLCKDYLAAVIGGELQGDAGILRQVASIVARVPVLATPELREELKNEEYDVTLVLQVSDMLSNLNAFKGVV